MDNSPWRPSPVLLALVLASLGADPRSGQAQALRPIRVVTYNLHQARGRVEPTVPVPHVGWHGWHPTFSLEPVKIPVARPGMLKRLADDIRTLDADIVLMQEVDGRSLASLAQDQVQEIARRLGMHVAGGTAEREGVAGLVKSQGNAILSRFPVDSITVEELYGGDAVQERRVSVSARIHPGAGRPALWVVDTHLSTSGVDLQTDECKKLADAVAGRTDPVIIGGDFNATPDSAPIRNFADALARTGRPMTDAQAMVGEGGGFTVPVPGAARRIDYVFHSAQFTATSCRVATELENSDHYPVVVDLAWSTSTSVAAAGGRGATPAGAPGSAPGGNSQVTLLGLAMP